MKSPRSGSEFRFRVSNFSTLQLGGLIAVLSLCLGRSEARAFAIVLRPGAALAGRPDALAAFARAAALWETRLADPIQVVIDADLALLSSGVIGQASSTLLFGDDFAEIRDKMILDALGEGGDAAVEALPNFSQISFALPTGRTLWDSLVATQANLKALGFTGLEAVSGQEKDATITFNSAFSFDFDNRDGVSASTVDFETAAAHEIGHALGFISSVDGLNEFVAGDETRVRITPLDLFRFGPGAGANPSNAAQFTNFARELRPGRAAHFDDFQNEWSLSTGTNRANGGDGNQASHWKADDLTGRFIGLMDPTLASGVFYGPTAADFRALDAIGYKVVPEPGILSLLATGSLLGLLRGRRRR